jgi:hypothetical protein
MKKILSFLSGREAASPREAHSPILPLLGGVRGGLLWLTIAVAGCMGACNQDPVLYGEEENLPEVLTIAVSGEDITLNPDMTPNEPVLTVTWNEAAPRGPYDEIEYVFKMDVADNAFELAYREEIPAGIFSRTFAYQELYELLAEKWRVALGSTVGVDVRIIATVYGPKFVQPEVATTRVNVKIFVPDPKPLYIMGTAVPNGGSNTDFAAKKIAMIETVPGKEYTYDDTLTTGDFIFVTDDTDPATLLPAYVKGADDTTLTQRTAATQPDSKFTASDGRYSITVRLDRLTAKISKKIVIGGIEWAPTNVDEKGTFAPVSDDPGKFYQFHYDIAYSTTDPLTPAWSVSTDKADTYWHTGTIPCPEGWSLPTGSQLGAMATVGSTWAAAGEKGNAVAGRFFGAEHATATIANPGSCIFIPAAGRRDSQTGELRDAGVKGFVHSINPYWGETSQVLVFDAAGADMVYAKAAESGGADILLGTAMTVRCIKAE